MLVQFVGNCAILRHVVQIAKFLTNGANIYKIVYHFFVKPCIVDRLQHTMTAYVENNPKHVSFLKLDA